MVILHLYNQVTMALNVDRRVEGGSDGLGGLGGLFLKIILTQDLGMGQESKAKGTAYFWQSLVSVVQFMGMPNFNQNQQ